ncbi:MAG: type II toxin-antitoxin system RelE/ParE family toxin [Bacteroidota bacterium]
MVKRKIRWSPRAKLDLIEILDFYFQRNGNKTYSVKINSVVRQSITLLEKKPFIGVQTDIPDVRNLIEGDYCIFNEIRSDAIEIITIWDNRQNPGFLNIKS